MRTWAFILAGWAIWAVHFAGVYGIASVADVATGRADAPLARWAVGALTLACAGADLGVVAAAVRRRPGADPLQRFATSTAGLGAGVSLVAVLWQGLPAALLAA